MVLLTITLCMNFAACSDDDADIPSTNVKTIHVEKGGTLATLMTEEEQSQVTDLILSGFLNGTDVNFIRGMRNLRKIDFTDAHIIGGGNSYAVDGRFFATSDNIFPPRCFYNLYNSFDLQDVKISNSVTVIGESAFQYCRSLTSVEIPNSVTTIGMFAFSDCTSLTSIEIPNSVTVIEGCAFQNCNLKEIHINSLTPPAVDRNAFSTYSYVTLYVPTESKDAYMAHDIWGKFGNIVEE